MTVADLIAELSAHNPDAEVEVLVNGVIDRPIEVDEADDEVLSDGSSYPKVLIR